MEEVATNAYSLDPAETEIEIENSDETSETSSLLSESSVPGDIENPGNKQDDDSHHPDITGVQLVREPEFWKLFVTLGF